MKQYKETSIQNALAYERRKMNQMQSIKNTKGCGRKSKPLMQVNPANGEIMHVWSSAQEAAEAVGVSYNYLTKIVRQCGNKTVGGYLWKWL